MKVLIFILFCGLILCSNAQEVSVQSQDALIELGNLSYSTVLIPLNQEINPDVYGSTFYYKEFFPGIVRLFENDKKLEGRIRFDVMEERIEMMVNKEVFLVNTDLVLDFEIFTGKKSSRFVNTYHYLNIENNFGLIRSVYEGETVSLFAKEVTKRSIQDSRKPYSAAKSYVKYTNQSKYLIYYDGKLIEVTTPKNLITAFQKLNEFGKISRSSIQKENYLIELVKWLN